MSIWLCIPSKRPRGEAESALALWRNQGYRLAIWRDTGDESVECNLLIQEPYPGYAAAVNGLAQCVLEMDPYCDWIVTGGDDVHPDPSQPADQVGAQCSEHFRGSFGVMQATGDRWGDASGAYIDRVCGSPWIGRDFCERAYEGNGPFFPGYRHMYVDEELQCVAESLGVLWQRRDLAHLHQHWGRAGEVMPGFLAHANSIEHWQQSKTLFERRKAAGFPGHQPIHALSTAI